MEIKQDDEDFINELLGHAGLGDLGGDMGASLAAAEGGGFIRSHLGVEDHYEGSSLARDSMRGSLSMNYLENSTQHGREPGQSIDESLAQQASQQFMQQPDFMMESLLFQHEPYQRELSNDDQLSSFTDDPVSSSLGSSIATADFMSPRSSSLQYHPLQSQQPRESVDLASYSQFLSSSLRSPPSSLRQGNFLSSSMRAQPPPHSSVGSVAQQQPLSIDSPGFNAQASQDERLRRRREFHNAVERRRRELIKQKVKELSKIVPPSLLNYDDKGKEVKTNKGVILSRSADYLQYLQQVLEVQDRKRQLLLQKIGNLEALAQQRHQTNPSRAGGNTGAGMHTQNHTTTMGAAGSASPEQIIDARVTPYMGDNSSSTPSTTVQDDLQQFLSGDLIEAEDNAKLMFGEGDGTGTTADFLLNFGK
ncbi:LAME_0E03114g1_1 [Lachancea meyersii CBS 8951]|uniref:LAME_0E03114g1_1 n=1 Tax=Lachancea meyersii CBS 8951 TaxID=1266667 RepID=A0A1G4JGJ6_9SACH|nr:LAME_0E03114g1_1 [Lachancea meyersii CBS 8951]